MIKSKLPSGAVATPGVARHLKVSQENGVRCSRIDGGSWFVDGGHLIVSQLQLEPANVTKVLKQTSGQCGQRRTVDVYRKRLSLKTLLSINAII